MDSFKSKLDIRYKILGVIAASFILVLFILNLGSGGVIPRSYSYMPMNNGMFELQQFLGFVLGSAIKIFTFVFLISLGFGSYYYFKNQGTTKDLSGRTTWIDKVFGTDRFCKTCNNPLSKEFKYCPNCKINLERTCTKCNRTVLNDWNCCPYCGEE